MVHLGTGLACLLALPVNLSCIIPSVSHVELIYEFGNVAPTEAGPVLGWSHSDKPTQQMWLIDHQLHQITINAFSSRLSELCFFAVLMCRSVTRLLSTCLAMSANMLGVHVVDPSPITTMSWTSSTPSKPNQVPKSLLLMLCPYDIAFSDMDFRLHVRPIVLLVVRYS